MSTHVERNHVVHVAGNSTRDCTDIERNRKTRPPTSCHQNSGANLDTFAKDQRLVSSQYYVSQKKLIEVLIGADHVLGLERELIFQNSLKMTVTTRREKSVSEWQHYQQSSRH
jgi:hypothetical protein